MTRLLTIILTLSFSMLLGVDTPKELESNPQTLNSPEITLDIENVQQVRQMKAGMNKLFKQARKANGIPKPDKAQFIQARTKGDKKIIKQTSARLSQNKGTNKSFKESVNNVDKADKQGLKETYLERKETSKKKLDELLAKSKKNRANARVPKYIDSGKTHILNNNKGERQVRMKNPDYDWNSINETRDIFGYEWNYSDENFDWIEYDPATDDTALVNDDDGFVMELPFEFNFYGQAYSTVGISSNNWLTFGYGGEDIDDLNLWYIWSEYLPTYADDSSYYNYSEVPAPVMAPYATDGYPNGGGSYYYYGYYEGGLGFISTGERDDSFVITWHNWSYCCETTDDGYYDFQVILYDDGDFVFQYNNVDDDQNGQGNWVTIGIQNEEANDGITVVGPDDDYYYDDSTHIYSGMRIDFEYPEDDEPDPPLSGTWKMAPEAGALMVGPAPNDGSWWSNSADDVDIRWCYFDDEYIFNADGSFQNVLDEETWIEGWQGGSDACGAPVYPHDGSNAATWDYNADTGTVTLNGVGAYLGLPKAWNGGELASPDEAPESITYDATLSGSTMTLVIEAGAGVFWTFKLDLVEDDPDDVPFIEGIVRDFDGNSIPGAFLQIFNEVDGYWSTEADDEGYYHIDNDSLNGMVGVFVSDTNNVYWPDLTMVDVSEGGNQFDFSLGFVEETTLIGVMAMTSNGDPVSFAEVHSPQSPQEMSYSLWDGFDFVTVDPSEGFADIFGYSEEYGEAYVQIDNIEAGMQYNFSLVFGDDTTGGDYGWIEGYVNDQTGSPIMDAWVNAWNYDYWEGTWTNEDGYYQMEVPAGYYEMEAGADGYSTDWTDVNVFPNEGSWVDFGLNWEDDYAIVSGLVTDMEGNPIPFALVNANSLYDEWESEGSFTDSSGYYELYLQEGDYRISAGAEGYWVSAYDSVHIGDTTNYWLPFVLENVESFDGAWEGNINLVGNYDPGMIYLGIMSEDYQVFRILWEPGPQEVELVNGTYHVFAGAEGYQEVFMPNAIQIENNVVNFDIFLIEEGLVLPPQVNWAGDVPNDQGRQMRLVWNPGMPGDWQYFPFYSIWRHVNEAPQNLWDYIATVPWHGMEPYSAVVPTLGDSTDMGIYWSTFRITAHTEDPMVFYDSQPVTGYSIDNISPNAPGGVQAFTGNDGVIISWDPPLEEDFGYHRVYRHNLDSEDPAEEFTTVDTFFVDNLTEGNYEYWVTTVDINGNESNPSEAVTVLLAIDDGLTIPTDFALNQNYPNPFNPSTQIQYALPIDANVSITIYDVMGREVRSLVNKTVSAGYHSTLWNATNNLGAPVSAGVYIYTISANEYRDVKKMILLK
jgi:protocatechuate 3,4-dioxygenase beta subunit